MAKRSYHRRSDEELIAELQDKIKMVERRMQSKTRADAPLLKELPKLGRTLRKFAQAAVDHGRDDLSNMTLAFLAGLQRAADELPDEDAARPRGRRSRANA
ncbi:MAG: hypothetical protein H6828_01525 [Planctomycetes bacterium]|nr:hypothetical protein [Planctomycetota bacterium]